MPPIHTISLGNVPIPKEQSLSSNTAEYGVKADRIFSVASCLLFAAVSVSLFAASDGNLEHKLRQSDEQPQVYRDPQGYFELILPAGWQVTDEYSSDPRGKVLFSGPDGLKWRIIVGAGNTSNLEDLRRNAQAVKNQFPAIQIHEGKVSQWDAVIYDGVIQGEYSRMFSFIASGEAHSFSIFGSQAVLERNWKSLETALQTYVPLARNSSEADRKKESLAHWIRLTQLFYEIGDTDNAKVSLRAAKELDAQDERVIALSEIILTEVPVQETLSIQDANSIGAENGNTVNPQKESEFGFGLSRDNLLNGTSKYVLAFFLLWIPLIGFTAAIGIGLLGKYAIQYTSNFAPLALFWVIVTAAGCFAVIAAPFTTIWEVWKFYAENGLVVPYVLNLFGGATLGALGYTGFRFYMSRVRSPHQVKAGSQHVVHFAKNYTLWRDIPNKNSAILNMLSMDTCPWKGKNNPESIAIAQADNCHLFFSESELLLSLRQDDQVFFESLVTKRVSIGALQYNVSLSDNTIVLTVVLRTGFLKKLTVSCVFDVVTGKFAPVPFDCFISNISANSEVKSRIIARVDDLHWFEPDAKRGFFSSFLNKNLVPAMELAIFYRILPQTINKLMASQEKANLPTPPKFIECVPTLLFYTIGMDIVGLNNRQGTILPKPEDIRLICDSIHSCSLLGSFLLRAWGVDEYYEDLKELCMVSGTWRETPSNTTCLDNIIMIWSRFGDRVHTNPSKYANDLASKIYTSDQIGVVARKWFVTKTDSSAGDKSTTVTSFCPKCKLSYKWNGTSCFHCGYNNEA